MPWLSVVAVLGLASCGDGARDPLGPGGTEASLLVSDPVVPVPLAPGGPNPALSIAGSEETVTYVSFPPGTAPEAN